MTVVSAGTRLGPYEVVSRVGAGGMGEVWKARDTIMTVPVKTSPVFTAGTPRILLDADASDFDLSRDGRVLIVEALDPAATAGRLNVVVNWFEEIRRR
jgi:serine/threonine protein kinase